jgi:hypothetical protein
MAAQRAAHEQGTELAHAFASSQVDAFESAVDEGEQTVRTAMDEQFEHGVAQTQELLNAQFEQGAEFVQQSLNAQLDAYQSVFDVENVGLQTAVDEQFGSLTDTQSVAWDEFEQEVLDAVADVSEQQRELLVQSTEVLFDVERNVTTQATEWADSAQSQA